MTTWSRSSHRREENGPSRPDRGRSILRDACASASASASAPVRRFSVDGRTPTIDPAWPVLERTDAVPRVGCRIPPITTGRARWTKGDETHSPRRAQGATRSRRSAPSRLHLLSPKASQAIELDRDAPKTSHRSIHLDRPTSHRRGGPACARRRPWIERQRASAAIVVVVICRS